MEAVGRASGDGVRLGDRDGDAVLAQERRARQAADAGADDHDVHLVGEFVGDPSGAFHRRDGGGGGRRAGREGRARAGEGVGVTTRGGNATVDGTRATVAWEAPATAPGRAAACAPCANEDMTASPQVSRRDACPAGCGTRRDGHPVGLSQSQLGIPEIRQTHPEVVDRSPHPCVAPANSKDAKCRSIGKIPVIATFYCRREPGS